MEELQLRLLKKQLMTIFFNFGAKRIFFSQKWWHHQKKVITLNMYIGFNVWKMVGAKSLVHGRPAQRFRHSIDSHCLCMWVKNEEVGNHSVFDSYWKLPKNSSHSQHNTVQALSPLALWYWCNMHIQLLSFKIWYLSQRFRTISALEFKSTASSWNVTLSCLFSLWSLWLAEPYHMVKYTCILRLTF